MNIEFRKSTEFNIAVKASGDIKMKIPGYNFTYPLLDGQTIVNVLMLNQKNIKRSDTKGRVYEYSFDGDDKQGILIISRKSGNTTARQEVEIYNKEDLMLKMQEYFDKHWEEYTDKNYNNSLKRNEEYRSKEKTNVKTQSIQKTTRETNICNKNESNNIQQSKKEPNISFIQETTETYSENGRKPTDPQILKDADDYIKDELMIDSDKEVGKGYVRKYFDNRFKVSKEEKEALFTKWEI